MQVDFKDLEAFLKKNLEEESTSSDFTDLVLGKIHAAEIEKEKALQSLLQKHIVELPPEDFSSNIMQVIENKEIAKYHPVISKKAWMLIATVLIVITGFFTLKGGTSNEESNFLVSYLSGVEKLFSFELPVILTSPIFALSLFALSTLLSIDYYLKIKSYT